MPIVSIAGMQNRFELENEEIIYHGLERQGEELPHGCLAGSCGACRIEVISGADNIKAASAIEQNTVEAIYVEYGKKNQSLENKTIRLACRAKLLGDIEITPLV